MIDAKDLESGDVFRWAGHITPQIALTLATAGAGAGALKGACAWIDQTKKWRPRAP